ncbi:hypothetical protein ACOMHN_020468 [Nucella lapillus]
MRTQGSADLCLLIRGNHWNCLLPVAHGTLRCELCAYFARLVCHPSKKALPETAPRQIWNDLTNREEKTKKKGGPPGASGIVPGALGIVVYIGSAQSVLQGMVRVFWNSGQKREWHSMGRDIYELDLA